MYTRHFNIPKNYNGVRFNSPNDGITVKEHRPSYENGVKTSHSPLYKQENTDTLPEETEEISSPPDIEEYYTKTEESSDTEAVISSLNEDNDAEESSVESVSKHFNFPIKELINGINREDALLICLILLIAAEQDKDNNPILTMLSLLLLKK